MDTNVLSSALRKCLNAALLPAAAMIVIAVILQAVAISMPSVADFLVLPVLAIDLILLAWTGYRVVKGQGLDLRGGVLAGAIAGAIASLVDGIINIALAMLGIEVGVQAATVGTAVLVIAAVLALVVSVIIGAIEGAVCGAIGAYVASRTK